MKKMLPFLFLLLMVCTLSISAAAAPGQVRNLSAKASENTIKLSWKKASSAKGYYIYRVNPATGAVSYFKSTKKTSYTIKGCSYDVNYVFKVCAYDKKKGKGPFSNLASVTPRASRPATPKNFRMTVRGNRNVKLSWSKVSKANGYEIQRYDSASKTWKAIKTLTSYKTKEATIGSLAADTIYQFRILSYKNVKGKKLYSNPSSTVSVTAIKMTEAALSVRAPYYNVKTNRSITVSNLTTGGKTTLAKGTSLRVTAKSGSTVIGYLNNGQKVRLSRSTLKYTGLETTPKDDYSKTTKEQYINAKGFRSPTKYLIWISHFKLKVNVFYGSQGNWTLKKTFPCCVGKWSTRTPTGLRRIYKKIRHGDYGGPYIYFSVGEKGTPSNPQGAAFHNQVDRNMSKAVSHGCVRMRRGDLVWLYNNCPTGTTVWSY